MHEAAPQAGEGPDRHSFLHAAGVVQWRLGRTIATSPRQKKTFPEAVLKEILQELVSSSRHRLNHPGVRGKMSNYSL